MITKERLDAFIKTGAPFGLDELDKEAAERLIQLCRLGIWAREYGIAAVHKGLENTNSDFCSHGNAPSCSWCQIFVDAINALLEVEK